LCVSTYYNSSSACVPHKLRIVAVIARTGNFTRVAQLLHMAQPTGRDRSDQALRRDQAWCSAGAGDRGGARGGRGHAAGAGIRRWRQRAELQRGAGVGPGVVECGRGADRAARVGVQQRVDFGVLRFAPASAGHAHVSTGRPPASAGPTLASAEQTPVSTGSAPASPKQSLVSAGHAPVSTSSAPASTGCALVSTGQAPSGGAHHQSCVLGCSIIVSSLGTPGQPAGVRRTQAMLLTEAHAKEVAS